MMTQMMSPMLAPLMESAVVVERVVDGARRDGPEFRDVLAEALSRAAEQDSVVVLRDPEPVRSQEDLVLAADVAGFAAAFGGAGDDFSASGALAGTLNSVASTGPARSVVVVVEDAQALDDTDANGVLDLRGHLASATLVLVVA